MTGVRNDEENSHFSGRGDGIRIAIRNQKTEAFEQGETKVTEEDGFRVCGALAHELAQEALTRRLRGWRRKRVRRGHGDAFTIHCGGGLEWHGKWCGRDRIVAHRFVDHLKSGRRNGRVSVQSGPMVKRLGRWLRRRWKRVTVVLLLAGVIGINVLAFMHAWAMTHFAASGQRTEQPEKLGRWGKAKVLVTGG